MSKNRLDDYQRAYLAANGQVSWNYDRGSADRLEMFFVNDGLNGVSVTVLSTPPRPNQWHTFAATYDFLMGEAPSAGTSPPVAFANSGGLGGTGTSFGGSYSFNPLGEPQGNYFQSILGAHIYLNGTITMKLSTAIANGGDFTISGWWYFNTATTTNIFDEQNNGASHFYVLQWQNGKLGIICTNGGSTLNHQFTTAVSGAAWHYIVLGYQSAGTTWKLTVDNGATESFVGAPPQFADTTTVQFVAANGIYYALPSLNVGAAFTPNQIAQRYLDTWQGPEYLTFGFDNFTIAAGASVARAYGEGTAQPIPPSITVRVAPATPGQDAIIQYMQSLIGEE